MDESLAWTGLLSECVFFVNPAFVNLDDMISAGIPGAIVRVDCDPKDAVFVHVAPNDLALGCVGGMISDAQ
jgi:hypothetical protein